MKEFLTEDNPQPARYIVQPKTTYVVIDTHLAIVVQEHDSPGAADRHCAIVNAADQSAIVKRS